MDTSEEAVPLRRAEIALARGDADEAVDILDDLADEEALIGARGSAVAACRGARSSWRAREGRQNVSTRVLRISAERPGGGRPDGHRTASDVRAHPRRPVPAGARSRRAAFCSAALGAGACRLRAAGTVSPPQTMPSWSPFASPNATTTSTGIGRAETRCVRTCAVARRRPKPGSSI